MSYEKKTLGEAIKAARDRVGLTQEKLAEKVETSTRNIQYIESGGRRGSDELRSKVIKAVGLLDDKEFNPDMLVAESKLGYLTSLIHSCKENEIDKLTEMVESWHRENDGD